MIQVWDYLAEYATEKDDILDAVDAVFSSGRLVLGDSVRGFEEEFAAYHGVGHCIGVDNGTNAVRLALESVGVRAGDEVITVSNTAAPTVLAIDAIGATPVFVDVREEDYLMDTARLEQSVTDRTRAIVPVHLYGQSVDMAAVMSVAGRHGLTVVEDCAQAHGARHHGRQVGTFGAAAAFSFYPTKVLGAYGDGGAVITDDADVEADLRRRRYYGMDKVYYVVQRPGHNSRLDEVQAEILRRKLTRLDAYVEGRRRVAQRYQDGLGDLSEAGLTLPAVSEGNDHVYYVYVVRHPRRDEMLTALKERGIHLNISYPWPVHTMSGFADLGYGEGSLPVTEGLAKEIFSLPMYPDLSVEAQDAVIAGVREVVSAL